LQRKPWWLSALSASAGLLARDQARPFVSLSSSAIFRNIVAMRRNLADGLGLEKWRARRCLEECPIDRVAAIFGDGIRP
jgi:hypothetical protein